MLLHNRVGDGQSQAGALADFLRCKERIEDPSLPLLRNTWPIVIDLEHGGAAIGIVRRAHDDGAAAVGADAGLLGVDHEVEQDLLDLVTIGEHLW